MLSDKELQHLEEQITELRALIRRVADFGTEEQDYAFEEHYEENLIYNVKQLYITILIYVEGKELSEFALNFRKTFENRFLNNESILAMRIVEDFRYNVLAADLYEYVTPLIPLTSKKIKATGDYQKLIGILDETPKILHHLKVQPKNESDINRGIRWLLSLYFDIKPSTTSRLIGKFKTYHPDILVPELETAIEYKYAKAKSNIEDYIDQLIVDATNYIGDPQYKNFIAVIYYSKVLTTKKDIERMWTAKKFPKNWERVLCPY